MPSVKLIVGLGNPGKRYALTRHNIGFMVIDELAKGLGVGLKGMAALEGEVGKGPGVVLLKPTTFMNLSGESVQKVMHYYKADDVLVISDDATLPFGTLRMREKGSSGGHNGLKSIAKLLGDDFPRLKIGVGAPGELDLSDYVLANFSEGEQNILPRIVEQGAEVCKNWLESGFQKAALETAKYEG